MTREEIRQKAKAEGLFLGTRILGYNFQSDVHGELFDYKLDSSLPLYDQPIVKDELILWPRGHYKTTARVVQAIQFILNFPDIRIVLMQGTKKLSEGLLHEIKAHFAGDNPNSRLSEFFPEFCGVRGTKTAFTVPARQRKHLKEPTCAIASGKSVKASQHYDLGIFDDLVNEQNFRNPTIVAQVTQDFNHCQSLIDPGGYRRVSGTRYTFGDLYEQIIRSNTNGGSWHISVKTCWADEKLRIPLFPARKIADGRTIGFTRELLDQMERDDPETFAAQQLNRPIASRSHLFPEAVIRGRLLPKHPTGLGRPVLFLDLASSKREESDHRVIIAGQLDSAFNIYVTRAVGGHYPPGELAKKIIEMSLELFPYKVLIEKTAPAVYLAELVKVLAQPQGINVPLDFIEVNNQKGAKYTRISGMTSVLPRLFFAPGLEKWERIVEEFDRFSLRTIGGHNDYPDTIALAVQWFTKNYPLVRPDPMAVSLALNPHTTPQPYIQMPTVSSNEYSLGSDFAS